MTKAGKVSLFIPYPPLPREKKSEVPAKKQPSQATQDALGVLAALGKGLLGILVIALVALYSPNKHERRLRSRAQRLERVTRPSVALVFGYYSPNFHAPAPRACKPDAPPSDKADKVIDAVGSVLGAVLLFHICYCRIPFGFRSRGGSRWMRRW